MKPEMKKRKRPRAAPTISFPRPGVASAKPEPEPEPAVMNGAGTVRPRAEIIEHMILRRDTGDDHGEEKQILPYAWPEYGLARIAVNEAPHRATLVSIWRQLRRWISGPRGYTSLRQPVHFQSRRWAP